MLATGSHLRLLEGLGKLMGHGLDYWRLGSSFHDCMMKRWFRNVAAQVGIDAPRWHRVIELVQYRHNAIVDDEIISHRQFKRIDETMSGTEMSYSPIGTKIKVRGTLYLGGLQVDEPPMTSPIVGHTNREQNTVWEC